MTLNWSKSLSFSFSLFLVSCLISACLSSHISLHSPAFPSHQEKSKEPNSPDPSNKTMPSNKPSSIFPLHHKPTPLKPSSSTNTTNQACAACKYQRRKCAPDCLLAPYFPHGRHRQFLNAHKLFGVSNITKIIKDLSPPDKDAAMYTIMFQSDARANDPIEGCYSIIRKLQYQIEYSKNELDIVLQQLAVFRNQHHQETHIPDART